MSILEHEYETKFEVLCTKALLETIKEVSGCPEEYRKAWKPCDVYSGDCTKCWFCTVLERVDKQYGK